MSDIDRQVDRKSSRAEQDSAQDWRNMTVEERFEAMRQMTMDAYGDAANQPMRKDITRLIKLHEK
jgi:hypothetical protein